MGMYTEIVAGFELERATPTIVLDALRYMASAAPIPSELPEHTLFSKPRWRQIGQGASYSFGFCDGLSRMTFDEIAEAWVVSIRCSLKNYDDEAGAFFDWIRPYVARGSGNRNMIGYSIYEEDAAPTIYYAERCDED